MKAIVLAAGFGSRIGLATRDRPKCMLPILGRTILEHQLRAFHQATVQDVVVVVGHGAQAVRADGIRVVHNPNYASTNILGSLLCAVDEICGPCLISYGDILYAPDVVSSLAEASGDYALVVDRNWARVYEGRAEHPVEQAELTQVKDGRIVRLGKCVGPESTHGEFIGLMKVTAAGASALRESALEVQKQYAGREDEPFADAACFRQAYLCDLLQHMSDAGAVLLPLDIHGRWREIDTRQDYDRALCEIDWL